MVKLSLAAHPASALQLYGQRFSEPGLSPRAPARTGAASPFHTGSQLGCWSSSGGLGVVALEERWMDDHLSKGTGHRCGWRAREAARRQSWCLVERCRISAVRWETGRAARGGQPASGCIVWLRQLQLSPLLTWSGRLLCRKKPWVPEKITPFVNSAVNAGSLKREVCCFCSEYSGYVKA